MQKTLKKSISILLSILMIAGVFAIVPFTASAASNGNFGNLSWNLDDNGLLTFSGSGAIPMEAFEKNGDVKKVIINDSVTELGAYAFLGCPNLTEVDIQNPSVSLKGAQHFATAGVTTVTLPEGMTTISYGMFRRCGALTTVDLPSTITRIEDLAFEGSGLQSISVPEGATYESNSFQTDSLQSLTLEGSSPMTFTGGEFTFLSDAATVFIPEGSTYVYSTTTLYVKDPSNWDAQEMLEYAQEDFNERIEFGSSPEEALAEVNDLYGDYYGITEPFTVTLNEGDKCEAVFGGATIGKYAPASAAVPYMAWDSTAKQLVEKTGDDACADYTVVADDTTAFEDGKWYVVSESVTVANRITVSGTANLILCDGKTLTASNGITVETDNTLNIYAQSTGENMGKLTAATTYSTVRNAVIGGVGSNDDSVPANACGTVNIHGGDISTSGYAAYSGYPGAGIGGGGGYNAGDGGTVTIYGGKVTARGGRNDGQNEPGPGIGGGYGGYKGGDGGTVTIYGGTVTATGGIGGGYGNGNGGNGGTVIIYDGTVAAYGDTGIGGGYGRSSGGNGGNVEIYGGKVTTVGSYTVGIGGGAQNADHGTLTVGRAQLVYGGDSQNPTTIIKKVNNDYARYRFMTVDTRELADDHEHTFVYTASGNTISATCSVENCEFGDLTPITLTLEAPSPAYDGNPKEAVLSGYPDDAPQGLAAAPTGIVYYTATAPGSTETTGSARSGAPTDAGNFVAQVTWGGETISVPFSVEYSLTINDGTYSYSNFPVYGYNADCYQKSQFVIPASNLTNLQGMTLTEMQFYLSYKADKVWNGTFEVYLGPCDFDLFSSLSFADISEHTKVYTGTLDGTSDTMNVVFDTGYTYTGGNLLVTFFEAETGAYARANFYGVNDNNLPNYTGIYAYNGSEPTFNSPSGTYFVPKVTIKYSAPEPKLFTGHSVTLGGDIGVNFFLNPAVLDTYTGTKTVKFTCDGEETTVAVPANKTTNGYMVTCNVVAARMAHKIHAVVYVGDTALDQTDDYSVQDYAKAVYAEPGKYLPSDEAYKAPALKDLAEAMLHYGGEAQTVFASALTEHPDRADSNLDAPDYSGVTEDAIRAAINGTASDLNAVAAEFGAEFYTSSLIYLQNNTLRLYFTPASKTVGGLDNVEGFTGNLKKYYYYADHANIAAAELDNQQEFTVGGVDFKFSALDYVIAVLNSSKMNDVQKNLAKSLYLYNQKANAYFDAAPAPAENEVISSGSIEDFSTLNVGDYIAKGVEYAADNDYKVVLTGGTYGTESRDGIVVRNGDYSFNAGEYGMGTYSAHVPQSNVFIEDYNENEKFYPAVDGVEGNAFVVIAKDDTQKIITIAGANVTQN